MVYIRSATKHSGKRSEAVSGPTAASRGTGAKCTAWQIYSTHALVKTQRLANAHMWRSRWHTQIDTQHTKTFTNTLVSNSQSSTLMQTQTHTHTHFRH